MPAKAASLPRRPPEKCGSSDGANGAAGALVSNTEACGWPTILRPKVRTGLLPAVCGGADCGGFPEGAPARKSNQLPSLDPSELSGRPPSGSGKGDKDIGLPLKIPSSGARFGGGTGWSGLGGVAPGKAEPTLRSRG